MKMKAFLINMPFNEQEYVKFSEKWEYIEDEYIGINIVHALLLKAGCEVVRAKDGCLSANLTEILNGDFDVVMIAIMQSSARRAYDFIKQLRKGGFTKHIFLGGWFAKLAWPLIFQNDWPVDYVCYVNAEEVLPNWVSDPDQFIDGIATKKNLHILENQQLSHKWLQSHWPENICRPLRKAGRKTYRLETSRGCPHAACIFCSLSCANVIRDKWKPLPVQAVLSEIQYLHNQYGATRFSMTDDDMLGPISGAKQRAEELRIAFKSLPFKISFSTSISVKAACDEDILDCLIDAGLSQLGVGFESADANQLKRYGKQQTLSDNFLAAENLTARHLALIPGLITFDPFATVQTIKRNLDFLWHNLHHYDLGKLTKRLHFLTGTPIVKLVEKEGLLIGDYLGYDYRFRDFEVDAIYRDFVHYTQMAKNVQIRAKYHGLDRDEEFSSHHLKVAETILTRSLWEETACQEISVMEHLLEGKNK